MLPGEHFLFPDLEFFDLLLAKRVDEEKDDEDEDVHDRGDQDGLGVHVVESRGGDVVGVENVVLVADGQERRVDEDGGDGLAELTHEGIEGVARGLVI